MDFESLYLRSPYWLQALAVNVQGAFIKHRRFGHSFFSSLQEYMDSDPKLIDHERLSSFLKTASGIDFWNDRFKKYDVDINTSPLHLPQEIKKLPILLKHEVKSNHDRIVNNKISSRISYIHTSGTTGSGMIFPQTVEMESRQWAVWWRYRRMHGISMDQWMGWFGGRSILNNNRKKPPYWHTNYPLKQIFFSAHHLNERTVEFYFNKIRDSGLQWIHGYPSQITLLAHLIREKNLPSLDKIKKITVGAENLNEHQRIIINEVFKCKVKQHYGLAEGCANISEYPNGELRPDMDFCIVEFIPVDDSEPEICRIIGTNYNNLAFPLIRYDTGDIATISRNSDGSVQILSIDGRQEDYITMKSGVRLGRLDHIFKDLVNIKEAQIIQSEDYSLTFLIVKDNDYDLTDSEKKLDSEIRKRIGTEVSYRIKYVSKIERTASGKLRLVKSQIVNF